MAAPRVDFRETYRGRRVFITGHTGFKGSWLTEWLLALGAEVTGYSLPPPTEPALFEQLRLQGRIEHQEADVRDFDRLRQAVKNAKPDFVFHLAAQPLVRFSYEEPLETYAVNVMGTAHLLEALRSLQGNCAAVMITTDKCYENREWTYGYREEDPLGGYDPYSSSKAAAELVIGAYRRSFFQGAPRVAIASARAGNVIGGGDWATDRIVPDCIRALMKGEPIPVRNRASTRPWQHVLEPLSGYLTLGAALMEGLRSKHEALPQIASAFNFGPALQSNRTVGDLVDQILSRWPGRSEDQAEEKAPHEARRLNLSTDKAFHFLGWEPVWGFEKAVEKTVDWYRHTGELGETDSDVCAKFTRAQISEYENDAR